MQPLQWKRDRVLVLDQRKLPREEVWLPVAGADEMARAIREMALRGAPLIGIAAAYGLALEAGRLAGLSPENLLARIKESAEILNASRPTAVNLAWAMARMQKAALEAVAAGEPISARLAMEAEAIHEEDRLSCRQIGRLGAELLSGGTVLTHCNTGSLATGGEGTAYAVIAEGFRRGKLSDVVVCEARPYLQGARLTAYELKSDHIPFTLITDSMAGHFLSRKKIQAVIVGADRVAANGDVANKIGTYTLAVLAKENQVPFLVAAPTSSFDPSIRTGGDIPIEERSDEEVTHILGMPIAPIGTKAAHPAFDVTQAGLITAIITEKGAIRPGRLTNAAI